MTGQRVYTVCTDCGLLNGRHRSVCPLSPNPGCANKTCNNRAASMTSILCPTCLRRFHRRRTATRAQDSALSKVGSAWMRGAACAGMDTELFFVEVGHADEADRAKAVCRRCPVKAECLEFGLAQSDDRFGIFGGASPRDRRVIRRERAETAA